MKTRIIIFLFVLFPYSSYCQPKATIVETMLSTFNFQGDTLGGGTCFMIDTDSRQYFVTAAHLFKTSHKSGDKVTIQMVVQNELENLEAEVFFHPNKNVDIALMKLSQKVSQGSGISLEARNVFFGDQVYFYGFPLTNMGTEAGGFKFPLIKTATVSGQLIYDGVDVLVLDGHNNHGFSGGPVLAYDSSKKKLSVIGVVSGYYFEPRNVQFKGEKLSFDENSGIIICYGRNFIDDLLKKYK